VKKSYPNVEVVCQLAVYFLVISVVGSTLEYWKLCSRLSSSEVRFYTENGSFAFLSP